MTGDKGFYRYSCMVFCKLQNAAGIFKLLFVAGMATLINKR